MRPPETKAAPPPDLAPRLRAAREAAGLTQAAAAARLGVTPSYLSQLESGHRRPNLEWLLQLAACYGAAPGDLDGRLAPQKGAGKKRQKN